MLPWWLLQSTGNLCFRFSVPIFLRNFRWKITVSLPRKLQRQQGVEVEEEKRWAKKLLVAARISLMS